MTNAILTPDAIKTVPEYTACLIGDSITGAHHYRYGISSLRQKDGVATVVTDVAHELWEGAEFTLTMPAGIEPEFSGRRRVTSVLDTDIFTFATSPDAPPVARDQDDIAIRHDQKYVDQGWFHWFNSRMHGAFTLLNNGAVTGARSDQLVPLIDAEVLAYKPQFCFVLLGANDAYQAKPLSQTVTALTSIYTSLLQAGITVVVLTVTPLGSDSTNFTKLTPRILRINDWIRAYARKTPGIILIDTYAALVDPSSATGDIYSGVLGGDGLHPTARGAKLMGNAIYDVMSDRMAPSRDALASPIDCYGLSATTVTLSRTNNLVTASATAHGFAVGDEPLIIGASPSNLRGLHTIVNAATNSFTYLAPGVDGAGTGTIKAGINRNIYDYGLMHVATGGTVNSPVTGTGALGMYISRLAGSGAAEASVVAAPTAWSPDGVSVGNAQRLVCTPAALADSFTMQSNSPELANRLIGGRSYILEGYVSFTGVSGSNMRGINFFLAFTVGGVTYTCHAHRRSLTTYTTEDFTIHMRSPVVKIPVGSMTNQYFALQTEFSAAGTALTVDFGRIRVMQVD